jgi:UDP-2-acetamido-3-amino-2,3-dideoxy-glucuronate N-acetyltransferase
MAVFDDVEQENKLTLYPHTISWNGNIPVPNKAKAHVVETESEEPLRAECRHFLNCIVSREIPRTDGQEGLRVLRVLQQCQEALQIPISNGKPVSPGHRSFSAHESAFIDEDVEIGEGTTIWHVSHLLRNSRVGKDCRIGQNVVIGPNVTIGNRVKIQNNVSVYEGVTLEDDVFCGPSAVFTNVYNPRSEIRRMDEIRPTLIRRGATLGANCTVVCGVTIGQYAFVGAGAVVTRDLPDFALAVGNPARIVGWMCACGHRIEVGEDGNRVCRTCRRRYEKIGKEVRAA